MNVLLSQVTFSQFDLDPLCWDVVNICEQMYSAQNKTESKEKCSQAQGRGLQGNWKSSLLEPVLSELIMLMVSWK